MKISPTLIVILAVAIFIAAITPFDVTFSAATLGSTWLRVFLIAALALCGAYFADRIGLRLSAAGIKTQILVGASGALIVALYVAMIDTVLFRHALPADYVQLFHTNSLQNRFLYFMFRAFNENVIYRLFLFSTLAWLLTRAAKVVKVASLPPYLLWAAMIAVQSINIAINVTAFAPDPLAFSTLSYDLLRYVVPGVGWVWLFYRYDFVTTEIAAVGSHLFLQPILGAALG